MQQGNQQRPPNHIITRPQMPGAAMQWIQQQVSFINQLTFFNKKNVGNQNQYQSIELIAH